MEGGRLLLVLLVSLGAEQVSAMNATLTLLHDEAQQKNAVCLDGSAPGYYMRPGIGESSRKWIVHLMGGGWCNKGVEDCYKRSMTNLGTTKLWPDTYALHGFLSDDPTVNPDFHDWNVVYVIYCDGGSFAGNMVQPVVFNGTTLYYRGYRILQAVITHLNKEREMEKATDIVLTGCSAGGLAVYLHADYVKSMVNKHANFKAFPDAGYFVDITDVYGTTLFIKAMSALIVYQNMIPALSQTCRDKYPGDEVWKCVFAPYIYGDIQTPIFVLNSMYDTAQLNSIYGLPCLPGNCTSDMMKLFEQFHSVFVAKIAPVLSSSNGYYFDSCLIHCQTLDNAPWQSYQALGHPMRESFADWYYERPSPVNATRVKDYDYPCNHSCP